MTLDSKLNILSTWTKREAHLCFTTYNEKYMAKHGGALHTAMMKGNVAEYIEKECLTFARYARMWQYHRLKQRQEFVKQYVDAPEDLPVPRLFAGKTPTPLKMGYE